MEAATMSPPQRSRDQKMAALQKANDHRSYRAQKKQQIKRGRADARTYLLAPPEQMLSMRIFDLLLAVPKVGRVKANRALVRCRVSPSKTLGGLSERQRHELAGMLLAR